MMIVKVWSWLTYSQKSKVWQMHTKIKLPISWAILTSFFVDNSLKLFEISWSFGIDVSLLFNQHIFNSNQDFVQAKQHRALCSSPGATYVLGRCCTERQNNEPDLVLAADFLNFSFRILPYPSFFVIASTLTSFPVLDALAHTIFYQVVLSILQSGLSLLQK